jgi:hypothetical protein
MQECALDRKEDLADRSLTLGSPVDFNYHVNASSKNNVRSGDRSDRQLELGLAVSGASNIEWHQSRHRRPSADMIFCDSD